MKAIEAFVVAQNTSYLDKHMKHIYKKILSAAEFKHYSVTIVYKNDVKVSTSEISKVISRLESDGYKVALSENVESLSLDVNWKLEGFTVDKICKQV